MKKLICMLLTFLLAMDCIAMTVFAQDMQEEPYDAASPAITEDIPEAEESEPEETVLPEEPTEAGETVPEEPAQEEPETAPISAGYVRVQGGTAILRSIGGEKLGSFPAAAVVYAQAVNEDSLASSAWLKIRFAAGAERTMQEGFLRGTDAEILPPEEIQPLLSVWQQDPMAQYQDGTLIPAAAFEAADSPIPEEPPAEVPEADSEIALAADRQPGTVSGLRADWLSQVKVSLSWNEDSAADGYVIYRKENDDAWKRLKSSAAAENYNAGLVSDSIYAYYVAAYVDTDSGRILGNPSNTAVYWNAAVTGFSVSGTQAFWDSVPGAECYRIYADGNLLQTASTNSAVLPASCSGKLITVTAIRTYEGQEALSRPSEKRLYAPVADLRAEYQLPARTNLVWSGTETPIDGCIIYRKEEDGTWKWLKTSKTAGNYNANLASGSAYAYYVRPFRDTPEGRIYGQDSNNAVYWNAGVTGFAVTDGIASWDPVTHADSYRLYADDQLLMTVDSAQAELPEECSGAEISVAAVRSFEGQEVLSRISQKILYERAPEVHYRALLIGETAYTTRLNGPDNDIACMSGLLSGLANPYDVYAQQNATLEEIIELISYAFDGATDDDVSLFYYSGHGVTGSGSYYSGALQTVDYQYLPTSELAELLSAVPGRVIVILDSCGSGAAIADPPAASGPNSGPVASDHADFSPALFNASVIAAFRAQDTVLTPAAESEDGTVPKSGELAQTKFSVLTGSAYEQNSLTIAQDGIWGGVLTRGIAYSLGCSFPGAAYQGSMPADLNADDCISFLELAGSCRSYAGTRQSVLSYSASPNSIFFRR